VKVGSAATASVNPHCDSLGVGQIRLGRHRIPIISHDANALCDAAKRWRKYRHSLRFCSLAAPLKAEDAQPSCAVALDAEACIVTQRCGPGCGMWALFAAWRLSRPAANQNPMQV